MASLESSVITQLADITATSEDGEHLILLDEVDIIVPSEDPDAPVRLVSPRAAAAFLQVGQWITPYITCGCLDCTLGAHVTEPPKVPSSDIEDEMVRKASRPSLAQLYKKARATGLVPASTAGYF